MSGSVTGMSRVREPKWLQSVLRMMAETHREILSRSAATKPKHGLATLRLDEFRGGRETTTHQYRSWRKQVLITQRLHGLSDPELALVMYTQVKGRAKQLLEILEVKDLEQDWP